MKRSTLIKMAAGFYLGAAPGILYGSTFKDWRWWLLVIPTMFLFEIGAKTQSEEND